MSTVDPRLALVLGPVVLALACSDPAPAQHGAAGPDASTEGAGAKGADTGPRSGTRLRVRLLVAGNGADDPSAAGLPIGWYDEKLGIDCRFTRSPDGGYRCLPILRGGLHVYSTPTCEPGTDLMALLDSPSTDGTRECSGLVFYGNEDPGCGGKTTGGVLRLVRPVSASLETHGYVESVFGACNRRPAPPPPPDPGPRWIYCAVEKVPLASFVAAEEQIRTVGTVRHLVLAGEDGSREPHAVLHPDFDASLVRDWWGGKDLVPDVAQTGHTCAGATPRVCDVALSPCAPAVLVRPDACSATAYATGAGPTVQASCGQSCFERGPALPRIPYAETALGTGRLRPLWVAQAGEALVPTGFFRDETLGTICRPEPAEAGKIRCVPRDFTVSHGLESGWREIFSDPRCRASLGFEYRPLCGEPAPGYVASTSLAYADGKLVRMVPLGEASHTATHAGQGPPLGAVVLCMPLEKPPAVLFRAEPLARGALAELQATRR